MTDALRRRVRRGAVGAVGVGILSGVTVDPTPGLALVVLGFVALLVEQRATLDDRLPWGGR